ncbi:MAG: type II secretion system F family protein [Acidiferrobacterales bacterium]|nr:type II secretion system F family protein [Acidiferrobacterales bacterium]
MGIAAITQLESTVAVFLLAALSVGAILFAAFSPLLSRDARLKSRLARIGGLPKHASPLNSNSEEGRRKRLVEDTLRELEAKQRAKAKNKVKPTLTGRMRQAGLNWHKRTYFMITFAISIGVYLVALSSLNTGLIQAIGFGIAGGLMLPHFFVAVKRNGRFKRFSAEFPNALDVIVRGVKSGMPLVDCLKVIATDAQEPVKGEFKQLIEDQTLGMPVDEALQRLAERVPLSEANFFSIVVGIQSRTGGNLSEALGNLSKVLRDRKNLRGKIKAMSAEAKASAGIIASMPVVVTILLYVVSPEYIELLITTRIGNIAMVSSLIWMCVGVFTMRKMINFDF